MDLEKYSVWNIGVYESRDPDTESYTVLLYWAGPGVYVVWLKTCFIWSKCDPHYQTHSNSQYSSKSSDFCLDCVCQTYVKPTHYYVDTPIILSLSLCVCVNSID